MRTQKYNSLSIRKQTLSFLENAHQSENDKLIFSQDNTNSHRINIFLQMFLISTAGLGTLSIIQFNEITL